MIRVAKPQDIPRIVELGRLLHEESSYRTGVYVPEKVALMMETLLNNGGALFVAERGGEIIGGMAGDITEQWFSHELVAFDYSLFIHPAHRHGLTALKLITAFQHWAKLRGATEIRMGITTGINVESTSKLYRSAGFEDAGVLFKMGVPDGR